MFSVDTEAEAKTLIAMACPMDGNKKYYARELVNDQTLDNLFAFGGKLALLHDRMVEVGTCKCQKR